MPRRYATYAEQFQGLNRLSTVGCGAAGGGAARRAVGLREVAPLGRPAPANPWGGATLEWATPSPPPHDNFAVAPRGVHPYDYTGLRHVSEEAGWVPVRKEGAP